MEHEVVIRKLYFLDRVNKIIDDRDVSSQKGVEYTDSIIEESLKQQNTREFEAQNDSSVVKHLVSLLCDCSAAHVMSTCGTLASRLIQKETLKQEQIENFSSLQRGGLFQALIKSVSDPTVSNYIFAKIDFFSVRDEVNFESLSKLPDKHKVFKSCILEFHGAELHSARIYDNSRQIATYWWRDYFELIPIVNDEDNTKIVFNETRSLINRFTKKRPDDRKALINRAALFFEKHDTFVFEQYITFIFKNYIPKSDNLDIENLRRKLSDTFNKKILRIDKQFTIHKEAVKKLLIEKNLLVNDNIEITLKGCVDDRPDLIKSYTEGEEKYLRVKIDEEYGDIYDRFRGRDATTSKN